MNKKIIIPALVILCLSFALAVKFNTFDNNLEDEILTFTGDQNITRYLTINQNATISSATLYGEVPEHIRGGGLVQYIENSDFQEELGNWTYVENHSSPSGEWINKSLGVIFPIILGAYRINSGSEGTSAEIYQEINFSKFVNVNKIVFSYESPVFQFHQKHVLIDNIIVGDLSSSFRNFNYYLDITGYTGVKNLTFRYTRPVGSGTSTQQYFDIFNIREVHYEPLIDPYLLVDNVEVWNYSGNLTPAQADTFEFATALNNAVTTCSNQSGDNCIIELLLHSDDSGEFEYSDIDIEWTEPIFPSQTINTPTGEYSTTQIPINISAEDNDELGTCKYWITRGASLEVSNTTLTCGETIIGTAYVSSQNTEYVFHSWVADRSGNSVYENKSFSTSLNATVILPPSGGGGGGGSVVIVDNTDSWTFSTAGQTELYELSMSRGTSRDLTLKFTNNGDARTIDLTCENVEGSACQFVEFDQDEFDLALLKDVEQTVGFTITIPEDTEKARYSFNIIAKDETGRQGNISVLLNVGTGSILTLFFSKLFSTSPFGVPYILLFIFSLAILGFIFSKIFDKSNNKALFTFVFTLLISVGIIIVL